MPDVAAFGRVGWADGRFETFNFADVDRTASVGISLGGKLRDRPDDAHSVLARLQFPGLCPPLENNRLLACKIFPPCSNICRPLAAKSSISLAAHS